MIRKRKFKDIKPKRGNIIKLSSLLSGVCIIKADDEAFVCDVKGIKENADDVKDGDMFLAVCGTQHDGFDYISKAISNGASVIIYEKRKKSFFDLYYKLRKIDEKKWWNKLTLEQRKSIHWLILEVYKLKNRIGGFSYEIVGNRRKYTNRPIIFVVTHVGKFDIEVVSEAIKVYCGK